MSRFDLQSSVHIVNAAVPRVLPLLLKWPLPGAHEVYDVVVALNPLVTAYLGTYVAIVLSMFVGARINRVVPLMYATLFCLHPVISGDRRTDGAFDTRLIMMCGVTVVWTVVRTEYEDMQRGFGVLRTAVHALYVVPALYFGWMERGGGSVHAADGMAFAGCVMAISLRAKMRLWKAVGGGGIENSAAELVMWWSFYLFSVGASGLWINWCVGGPTMGMVRAVWLAVGRAKRKVEAHEKQKDL